MSTPAAKRRRIEAAADTLKKPFKSPLISRQLAASSSSSPGESRVVNPNPAKSRAGLVAISPLQRPPRSQLSLPPQYAGESAQVPGRDANHSLPDPPEQGRQARRNQLKTRPRATKDSSHSWPEASQPTDSKNGPNEVRENPSPSRAVLTAQEGVAVNMGEDAELAKLISKWKFASRLAAEEVFRVVKERVDNAGGLKAWKETKPRQQDSLCGFDEVPHRAMWNMDDDGTADEPADYSLYSMKKADDTEAEEMGVQFTMCMMLRSLNIDPDLLGYSEADETWAD